MSNATQHQTNFTSGEISPYLSGRVDLSQYANSADTIQNFLIRPQGGLVKRSGTTFVHEIKNSANDARLIPFEYSNTDAYILELGAGYFRFYRNGAIINSTAAITNGTFGTDLTGWSDIDTGTGVSSQTGGVMRLNGGAAGVAKRTQAVTYMGTSQYTLTFDVVGNTVTYSIGTTSGGTEIATGTKTVGTGRTVTFTPSTAGTVYISFSNANNDNRDVDNVTLNTPIYQIDNPYSQDEINNINFAQSYDILYLVNSNYAPRQLARFGHASWTFSQMLFVDGPYYDITDSAYGGSGTQITLDPSAATGSGVTMTASSALFVATDVGRYIRYRSVNSAAWGYCVITAYSSATSVTVTVNKDFDSDTASKEWRLGAWSGTTGYPGAVTFNEQRLVFASSLSKKQTVWFSTAGNILNFQPDNSLYKDAVDATTAMTYTIADNKANVIHWLASQKVLYIGTSGGIWVARASSQGEAMTPDNITMIPIINDGAKDIQPLISRTAVVYPQRFGRKLLEIGYSFTEDTYKAADLAILAEHRTEGLIKWVSPAISPNYLAWVVMEDGTVSCLTYVREQNVVAWSRHVFGGTSAFVKSIATIPGSVEDVTYMIVSRTINGSTKQYIEYISETFLSQDIDDAIFVDCSSTYSGVATATITGLSYLEGQTVQVFGDGGRVVVNSGAVTGGSITLDEEVEAAVVGLPYDSIVKSNAVNVVTQAGTNQGRRTRIYKTELQIYRSYGGEIGGSADTLDEIPGYSSETFMDEPLTLTTGVVEHFVTGSIQFAPSLYIKHSLPVPFTLLGVIYRLEIK